MFYYEYQPYYPQFSKEENNLFEPLNWNFCETLQEFLEYDFQTFWCVLLFSSQARAVLKDFIFCPVYDFDYDCLNEAELDVYVRAALKVLHIYQRMLQFKESEVSDFCFVLFFLY